jgi:DegV family protein with EDD domain
MQIVTDRASDLLAPQIKGLDVHFVPMKLTLDGKTYSSGVDVTAEQFYDMLEKTEGFPTTSQPSAGDFAELYRTLAKKDPEILSIHVSSGLSGTVDSARMAASMVPEAKVTVWDTMTLSTPQGWQVEAAGRLLNAGWSLDEVFKKLKVIGQESEGIYTLDTLRYLIHGGRISHLKGLVASVLQLRPVIAVDKTTGKYFTHGQERTMKRAVKKIADVVAAKYKEGSALRVQLLHGKNLEMAEVLREELLRRFKCHWTPTVSVAPILGAHTGGGVVGLGVGPYDLFCDIPEIVMD